jgi:CXXX repeat modification system protein
MTGERIAEVTDAERDEIVRLHERRTALKELFLTLSSPYLSEEERATLKEGLVEDLARTSSLYEHWWREIWLKYHLERHEHGEWMIDFETKQISFRVSEGPCCAQSVGEGSHCLSC